MHTRTTSSLSVSNHGSSGPVIDLTCGDSFSKTSWARLLLSLGLGGALLLAGVLAVRFYVLTQIQPPVEAQLEFLAHWFGLSNGLTGITWMLTFGLSALFVTPFIKKCVFILSGGLSIFRPKPRDWALLLASPLAGLIPQAVEALVPVREVDPSAVVWFHAVGEKNTGEPRGRIGFVREADGGLSFYSIPNVLRGTDGRRIERVTPDLRLEWESRRAGEARQRAAEEADRVKRESLRRQHEENMARLRAEVAREETARLAARKAEADAIRARAEAEKARVQAAENARLEAQATAEREATLQRQHSAGGPLPRERTTADAKMERAHVEPTPSQRYELQHGLWRWVRVNGRCVEVWSNGPITLSADEFQPLTYPAGSWVRFENNPTTIYAAPAGPGTSHILVRTL